MLLAGLLLTGTHLAAQESDVQHSRQGLIDLLMEYLSARYPDVAFKGDLLYVSVRRQRLFHIREGRLMADYAVATSSKGLGAAQDSYRTPTGLHRVNGKFGEGVPPFGILRDREFTGSYADPDFEGVDKDWITSRVLWLDGQETGVNSGAGVDSRTRFIYIHGTANEGSIGTPSSMGCIRMRNHDVIELFGRVPDGTPVVIFDN